MIQLAVAGILTAEARRSLFDMGPPQEQMTVEGGVARIPIAGVLMRGADMGGTTDLAKVAANIEEANGRKDVRGILLAVDSPGGAVNGTPEAAEAVKSSGKPVMAYVSGQCCSAALWITSAAHQVFTAPSADVGSIGCFMAHYDLSGMLAQMGVKAELITSGKYKGMGMPGVSLTNDQRAQLQTRVDAIAADFKDQLRVNRFPRALDGEIMHGQVLSAKDAHAAGLTDGLVTSEARVRAMLG